MTLALSELVKVMSLRLEAEEILASLNDELKSSVASPSLLAVMSMEGNSCLLSTGELVTLLTPPRIPPEEVIPLLSVTLLPLITNVWSLEKLAVVDDVLVTD